jgi:serine/threonine protein phosphatase PrpC
MAEFVVRVGACSAQGPRPNNQDRFVADAERRLYLIADGMGGQEFGEKASGLAADLIPRIVEDRLAAHEDPSQAMREALDEANQAIIQAGKEQAPGRRMGTTAVVAVQQRGQVYVASLGDSRAYLIRDGRVEQLTIDHTVAEALERDGFLTHEQACHSPWRNVLYKFLGCAEMKEGAEVLPFTPQAGDRLVLGSDGMTNFISHDDLRNGAAQFAGPQAWADEMVRVSLTRGSNDNVTVVVVAFDRE